MSRTTSFKRIDLESLRSNYHAWKPKSAKILITESLQSSTKLKVNQYTITKEVGSGASSRVYNALDGDREIAIKVIKKSMINRDATKCVTLNREITAL